MSERDGATYAIDPPTGAHLRHYLAAMLVVAGVLGGAVRALDHVASSDAPSDTQDAVLIDLPPAESGAHPQGDDAPTQEAAPASAGAEAPPPQPQDVEPPKPAIVETPTTPPPQQAAPASAPRDAHEAGPPRSARDTNANADDTETHRTSAHLITLWQKALMARLQAARHGLHEHLSGLVKIAFEIDRDGHLVSERLAKGSGSPALDAAALALVRRGAPYPAPPRDAGAAQLSFVVPISFKR